MDWFWELFWIWYTKLTSIACREVCRINGNNIKHHIITSCSLYTLCTWIRSSLFTFPSVSSLWRWDKWHKVKYGLRYTSRLSYTVQSNTSAIMVLICELSASPPSLLKFSYILNMSTGLDCQKICINMHAS